MTDYAQDFYPSGCDATCELPGGHLAAENARLRADNERLIGLLSAARMATADKPAPRPKVARKAPAASWPGRHAMVDDLEAGFTAADYLATSRAGWVAPGPATLDPWMLGAPIPVGADAMTAAGWLPIAVALQGGRMTGGYSSSRAEFDGSMPNADVTGWAESPAYHAAVCIPHTAAVQTMRAEHKAARDAEKGA